MPQWSWTPHWQWMAVELGWMQLLVWAEQQRGMTAAQQAEAKRLAWRFHKLRNRMQRYVERHPWVGGEHGKHRTSGHRPR